MKINIRRLVLPFCKVSAAYQHKRRSTLYHKIVLNIWKNKTRFVQVIKKCI